MKDFHTVILLSVLISIGLLVSCNHSEFPQDSSAKQSPQKHATQLHWTRSQKDPKTKELYTMWEFNGTTVDETIIDSTYEHLTITQPHITYYHKPGNTSHTTTIQAISAQYNEKQQRIIFTDKVKLHSFDTDKNNTITITASSLTYNTKENTLFLKTAFTLTTHNAAIKGNILTYSLRNEIITIQKNTNIILSFPKHDTSGKSSTRSYTITTHQAITYVPASGILHITGPAVIQSNIWEARGNTMEILLDTDKPILNRVRMSKGIVFTERTINKRHVIATNFDANISHNTISLTGSPKLYNKNTIITCSSIVYHSDTKEFSFSKPFRLEHQELQ